MFELSRSRGPAARRTTLASDSGAPYDTTPYDGYSVPVTTSSLEEQAWLVTLLRTKPRGTTWTELTADVRRAGDPRKVLDALEPDLELFASVERESEYTAALADVTAWAEDDITFLTILDGRYPGSVRDIHQAPPFLCAQGTLLPVDVGVSVVGSRNASAQGLKMATSIATALVDLGVSVISGLAKGIDTAAHRATLAAGGRPVGVIGTGIRIQYPAENRGLHADVAEAGLLISQFWPDAPPRQQQFPMRNATMSGYGIATVVVEAGEHSGARTQARLAVEHGRPVILTDMVVSTTKWAQALVGRPGVHVCSATTEVMDVVQSLIEAPHAVDEVLDSLVLA